MKRTILSLAILKTNWHKLGKDYVENFVPFVATLVVRKKYSELDPKIVSDDFRTEFGLVIPIFPTITILKRASTRGVLRREQNKFIPDYDKAAELDFTANSLSQQRESEKVLAELRDFAASQFGVILDDKAAEDALIGYLRDHDLDILFAAETLSPLPDVTNPKKVKYIVNIFIKECFKREPSLFGFILDVTVGHALAATILYKEFNSFSGKLNSVTFYFDTRFVIRLLGLEGPERQASAGELILVLTEDKASLKIFDRTFGEIEGVLYDCLAKLQKGNVDMSKASRVLRHFVTSNKSSSDVEQLLVTLKSKLSDNHIQVDGLPDFESLQEHQIDEKALLKHVLDSYASVDPQFDKIAREQMVRRDVEVVSGIFRLRRGSKPRTIKDSTAIFVTPNNGLAFSVRRFEAKSSGDSGFFIPTCVTDVFLGTLIWLQSPAKVQRLNERRIIADCYAALQPSDLLIKRYVDAVEQLKQSGKITNDEYYLLRTHRTAMNLLEEKTFGDPDAFDAKTPQEILDDIIASIRKEEKQKYLEEKSRHDETKAVLEQKETQHMQLESSLEAGANKISNSISMVISALIFALFLLSLIYQTYPEAFPQLANYGTLLLVVALTTGAISVLNGFNILSFRTRLTTMIKNQIMKLLKGNAA